jgi:hypothetical protein
MNKDHGLFVIYSTMRLYLQLMETDKEFLYSFVPETLDFSKEKDSLVKLANEQKLVDDEWKEIITSLIGKCTKKSEAANIQKILFNSVLDIDDERDNRWKVYDEMLRRTPMVVHCPRAAVIGLVYLEHTVETDSLIQQVIK